MPPTATTPTLDATKRVHYTLGLVLGEDEFRQEQAYLIERDRLHARSLHGYGTVSGLRVRVVPAGPGDAEVQVSPGLAVDPFGESIVVDATQCARLAAWLSRPENRDRAGGTSPPAPARVYLTLAYRERLTDDVPVPGAPCLAEDNTSVASRIDDAFELAFSFDRPPHVEDAGVRRFADFLGRITLVPPDAANAGDALDEAAFLEAVRAYAEEVLASPPESPPSSPPGSPPESPPAGPGPVLLLTTEADDLLRAGLRVWVTELRPGLVGGPRIDPREPGDDRVLLAELSVGVERDGDTVRVASVDGAPDVAVIEDDRPYLLSTRLIQERLLAHFDVRFEETLGVGDAAGGDLAGTYPSPSVRALQTRAVADAAPANGNVLTWNAGASQWEPRAPAAPGGGLTLDEVAEQLPAIPLATIVSSTDRDRGEGYFLWFHLDTSPDLRRDNLPVIERIEDGAIAVFAETDTDSPAESPFLRRLDVGEASGDRLPRNTFFLPVEGGSRVPQLRFRFDLERLAATVEGDTLSLREWVARRPLKWVGHDGERVVTAFHVNVDDDDDDRPTPPDDRPPPRDDSGPRIVAAGRFEGEGRVIRPVGEVAGDLSATALRTGDLVLQFDGYDEGASYVVTGSAVVRGSADEAPPIALQVVAPLTSRGIVVRLAGTRDRAELDGFMVQVLQIGG